MEQPYLQYGPSHNSHNELSPFPEAEPRSMDCSYTMGPSSTYTGEWFQPTLHPDSVAPIYQPLPYLGTTSGAMSHYDPNHLVEASNTHILAHSTPPMMQAAVPSPSWELLSSSEGSQSPAEEREEEVWEPEDLRRMGYLDASGNWRCKFEGCRSSRVFMRACDLRKHFRGHDKYFFCTEKPCANAGVGFATRKDYQRHMGSHRPTIKCPHQDCGRIFSRKDNMREHFKKIHLRLRNNLFPRPCRRPRRGERLKSPILKVETE
ncbi:C2H2 type zinc finger domain protein [Colletotrichum scovillei]|uniref:C2H2 type zinc finger domain protein n=1 Tax=Colletotrichum scovillei TaxID=1209932 RepID=A0A9P7RIB8_9PEZI|nr:C2H2 type zinc finger domain protein [Colletotrichum scovillei]KAG7075506.1 C2H2 type zinc finger domain protein [Colletotrichum scovillei]KAG7082657.1 C2H2 type zinc finger domain protein [Colletotrichum scovillei]